ncbi:MAG TPA: M28 family peptidase [Acidobacteriota bacterium]|jgi:hypothetical protein
MNDIRLAEFFGYDNPGTPDEASDFNVMFVRGPIVCLYNPIDFFSRSHARGTDFFSPSKASGGVVSPLQHRWRLLLLCLLLMLLFLAVGGLLMINMPGRSYKGPLAPLSRAEQEIREHLRSHVQALAGDIGERNLFEYRALKASVDYIQKVLQDQGYNVGEQEYQVKELTVKNIDAQCPGTGKPEKIIIVGAHYDSVYGCPGANDNATGVAALLEIARLIKGRNLPRSVRFVAFVNEEPPFFQTSEMGSWVYAQRCRQRSENIVGMLSLETIGCYLDFPGSQIYPFPFSLFYPNRGNFIGFVGNTASRDLVRRTIRTFRRETKFPSEGVAAPGIIPGIGWSDHWAFWKQGYPAVMITDTALYRYRYYHTNNDTPDKIDYDRMARVVAGLMIVLEDLAK